MFQKKNINSIIEQIAITKNKMENQKIGFQTHLTTMKNDQKIKYTAKITDLQNKATLELAEKEKYMQQFEKLTNELTDLQKPYQVPKEKIVIDYSSKTEATLKKKEKKIIEDCQEKFIPLKEKIQEEHEQLIQQLNADFEQQLSIIENDQKHANDSFIPRVFITQEEIEVRRKYETTSKTETIAFEKERDKLKAEIKEKQVERDKILQKITDDIDETLFNEEKEFNKQMKELENAIPVINVDISIPSFDITPEQEQQFRIDAEKRLESEFKVSLAAKISKIAEEREKVQKQIPLDEAAAISRLDKQNSQKISNLENEVEKLEKVIQDTKDLIQAEKIEWRELNSTKSQKKEICSELLQKTDLFSKQIESIQEEINSYNTTEVNVENEAISQLLDELDALQVEMTKTHKLHMTKIKYIKQNHS